mgnify:CR=1 FL=1
MQSDCDYAKTLKGEYSAAISHPLVPNLNGRWFASNRGRSWTTAETVLQEMQPSAESLTGRPPDTVLQSMQPSAGSLTGRPPDTVVQLNMTLFFS